MIYYYRVSFRRKKKEEPAKEVAAKTAAVKEEPKKVRKEIYFFPRSNVIFHVLLSWSLGKFLFYIPSNP
jgi:hypothetical protein